MNVFVRPRRVERPTLRLIVFHHAGGSAAAYYPLAKLLPADWEVLLHEQPGRGLRRGEPIRRDMRQVVDGAFADVLPHTDATFALFGHSMGAIVAAEVGRRLVEVGRQPLWVGVSGRRASQPSASSELRLARMDDTDLFRTLLELGGTPERLAQIPELKALFLRVTRADLQAVGSYRPDRRRPALPCPLTAFGGISDPWASPESLSDWQEETVSDFRQSLFPGGHFYFLDTAFAVLAREIRTEARAAIAAAVTG